MRSNRAGVTIFFSLQLQLPARHGNRSRFVALQHLTAHRAIMSPRVMSSAASRPFPIPASAPRTAMGADGLGRITTGTTATGGVRWVVFA